MNAETRVTQDSLTVFDGGPRFHVPTGIALVVAEARERMEAFDREFNEKAKSDPRLYKNYPLVGHSVRTAGLCESIARLLGYKEYDIQTAQHSGFLHDLGKLLDFDEETGLPLHRIEGVFDERRKSKKDKHAEMSAEYLHDSAAAFKLSDADLEFLKRVEVIVQFHHYWFDVRDPHLRELTQIVHVADCFDAQTEVRGSRQPMPRNEALERAKRELLYEHKNRARGLGEKLYAALQNATASL